MYARTLGDCVLMVCLCVSTRVCVWVCVCVCVWVCVCVCVWVEGGVTSMVITCFNPFRAQCLQSFFFLDLNGHHFILN